MPHRRAARPCALRPAASDADRIVFIGRFDLHKGGDLMIDAFAHLASSRPGLCLDFVGPDRGIPEAPGRLVRIDEYIEHRISDGRGRPGGFESTDKSCPVKSTSFAAAVPSQSSPPATRRSAIRRSKPCGWAAPLSRRTLAACERSSRRPDGASLSGGRFAVAGRYDRAASVRARMGGPIGRGGMPRCAESLRRNLDCGEHAGFIRFGQRARRAKTAQRRDFSRPNA